MNYLWGTQGARDMQQRKQQHSTYCMRTTLCCVVCTSRCVHVPEHICAEVLSAAGSLAAVWPQDLYLRTSQALYRGPRLCHLCT